VSPASKPRHWVPVINTDKRSIFRADSHAQRAADFVDGLQPPPSGKLHDILIKVAAMSSEIS
jgi:antirestriction protein ArdC